MSKGLLWNLGASSLRGYEHDVTISLELAQWQRFRYFFEDHDEIAILDARLDDEEKAVMVTCGSTSSEMLDRLHEAWG